MDLAVLMCKELSVTLWIKQKCRLPVLCNMKGDKPGTSDFRSVKFTSWQITFVTEHEMK
jgi:hypothetical protein